MPTVVKSIVILLASSASIGLGAKVKEYLSFTSAWPSMSGFVVIAINGIVVIAIGQA